MSGGRKTNCRETSVALALFPLVVKPGESLRLGFGVAVHESAAESDYSPSEVYQYFARPSRPAGR